VNVRIRPEIESLAVPIGSITPHPRNIRQGDIGAISVSLQAHGQYRPILIQRSTGFILAGNPTWAAAERLGCTEIAATYVDVDENQAIKILLADNKSSDLASYDEHALTQLLGDLAKHNDMDGSLWDQSDINGLIRLLGSDTLISDTIGSIADIATEGASNPLDRPAPVNAVVGSINQMVFAVTPEERLTIRDALNQTGKTAPTDQLLEIVEFYLKRDL
jgi:hypothetical protein